MVTSQGWGIVEIFFNNEWSPICLNDWDHQEAVVVCRMLGFEITKSRRMVFISKNPSIVKFDKFQCSGTENSLLDCVHRNLDVGFKRCITKGGSVARIAGVDCTETDRKSYRMWYLRKLFKSFLHKEMSSSSLLPIQAPVTASSNLNLLTNGVYGTNSDGKTNFTSAPSTFDFSSFLKSLLNGPPSQSTIGQIGQNFTSTMPMYGSFTSPATTIIGNNATSLTSVSGQFTSASVQGSETTIFGPSRSPVFGFIEPPIGGQNQSSEIYGRQNSSTTMSMYGSLISQATSTAGKNATTLTRFSGQFTSAPVQGNFTSGSSNSGPSRSPVFGFTAPPIGGQNQSSRMYGSLTTITDSNNGTTVATSMVNHANTTSGIDITKNGSLPAPAATGEENTGALTGNTSHPGFQVTFSKNYPNGTGSTVGKVQFGKTSNEGANNSPNVSGQADSFLFIGKNAGALSIGKSVDLNLGDLNFHLNLDKLSKSEAKIPDQKVSRDQPTIGSLLNARLKLAHEFMNSGGRSKYSNSLESYNFGWKANENHQTPKPFIMRLLRNNSRS